MDDSEPVWLLVSRIYCDRNDFKPAAVRRDLQSEPGCWMPGSWSETAERGDQGEKLM